MKFRWFGVYSCWMLSTCGSSYDYVVRSVIYKFVIWVGKAWWLFSLDRIRKRRLCLLHLRYLQGVYFQFFGSCGYTFSAFQITDVADGFVLHHFDAIYLVFKCRVPKMTENANSTCGRQRLRYAKSLASWGAPCRACLIRPNCCSAFDTFSWICKENLRLDWRMTLKYLLCCTVFRGVVFRVYAAAGAALVWLKLMMEHLVLM